MQIFWSMVCSTYSLTGLNICRRHHHHLRFNGCLPGEPGLVSPPRFPPSTYSRREPWRISVTGFYGPNVTPVIRPSVSKPEGNPKHWTQPVYWPHPRYL